MFLASTSDIIRIVTASAVSTIGVQAAWADSSSGTTTPGRTNTAITSNTTTTVVASPASSTYRSVTGLRISNNHASSSNLITVQHYDGSVSTDLFKTTLYAGETLVMDAFGKWHHLTAIGAEYDYSGPAIPNYGITGTLAETVPRNQCVETISTALTSGTLHVTQIYLRAGLLVSNISYFSASTAAGTPTNQFFALYDGGQLNLLARSANDTTTAWAANTIKTLAMSTPYTVQATGLYYVGVMVTATTPPTLKCHNPVASVLTTLQPILRGAAGFGTTALPDPMTIPSSSTSNVHWAAVS